VNSSKFPILAKIARDVLAISITTVASESAFSTEDRLLDPFQSSLAPRTVEALVCSQNWLRSKPLNYDSKIDDDEESYKLDAGKLSNLYHNNALFF
jgi:inhibitor of KinA sporulation pathway (predicted exonuclease)